MYLILSSKAEHFIEKTDAIDHLNLQAFFFSFLFLKIRLSYLDDFCYIQPVKCTVCYRYFKHYLKKFLLIDGINLKTLEIIIL